MAGLGCPCRPARKVFRALARRRYTGFYPARLHSRQGVGFDPKTHGQETEGESDAPARMLRAVEQFVTRLAFDNQGAFSNSMSADTRFPGGKSWAPSAPASTST